MALGILLSCAAAGASVPTPAVARLPQTLAPGSFLPSPVNGPTSEIKLAISPDGKRLVWGVVEDGGRLQLRMSQAQVGGWTAPLPLAFASDKDFDPAFSPDGKWLYFFSDRQGGYGGDDIWRVPMGPGEATLGTAENLGPAINSSGNEWAPGFDSTGRSLIFSSNGRGGSGKQDLFIAAASKGAWASAVALGRHVNSPMDDFDAAFVGENAIIFARGDSENGPVQLYIASINKGVKHRRASKLGESVNCSPFVLGPSVSPRAPGTLFISADCNPANERRMDINAVSVTAITEWPAKVTTSGAKH